MCPRGQGRPRGLHLWCKLLGLPWFWWEEQNSEFPKNFFGTHLFVFVEYLCNRSLKFKTKNIKNYSSILAIANHRKWLPLTVTLSCKEAKV